MAHLSIFTVFTTLWLICQSATAQQFPRRTGTITSSGSPTRTASKSQVTSSYSELHGPFLAVDSSTWSQFIIPVTVGTVLVTINEATNQTYSTTIYHTDFVHNGSTSLLTRTDTDVAGTVTQLVTDYYSSVSTVTYPTNFFDPDKSLTWTAVLPTYIDNATCCFEQPTFSATPTHTPFVEVGSLNTADPSGWLYTLIGVGGGEGETILDSVQASSLFAGKTLSIDYGGCPYAYCNYTVTQASPASGVAQQAGGILATSTTTISSLPDDTTSSVPSSTKPSASPTSSTAPETTSTTVSSTALPSPTTTSTTPLPAPATPSTTSEQISTTVAGQATTSSSAQQASSSTTPEQPQPATSPTTSSEAPLNSPTTSIVAESTPSTQVSGAPPQTSTTEIVPPPQQTSSTTSVAVTASSSLPPPGQNPSTSTVSIPAPPLVTAGQTILPGSSITLGSGSSTTLIAVQTSGSDTVVVIGGSISSTLAPVAITAPSVTPTPAPAPVITIGSSTISANPSSQFIISGQTLAPGSSITIGSGPSTTVIELQISATNTVLVIGGQSSTLTLKAAAVSLPPITVGSSIITANSSSNYIIGSQTLAPGGTPIVVEGTTISVASGGTEIVQGTTTIIPQPSIVSQPTPVSQSLGIGGIINSIIGGSSSATATSVPAGTASSGSTAAPTFSQASSGERLGVSLAVVALCAVAMMWSGFV